MPAVLVAAPFFRVENLDERRAEAAGHIYDLSPGPWPPTVLVFLFAAALAFGVSTLRRGERTTGAW